MSLTVAFHCHLVAVVCPSKLFPPGRRKKDGPISASASAISVRIPFALFLNVGGKRENMAKLIVCPDAAVPSTVTAKTLVRLVVPVLGVKEAVTCFQAVWLPESWTVAEPKTWPEEDWRATTALPLKLELVGNL